MPFRSASENAPLAPALNDAWYVPSTDTTYKWNGTAWAVIHIDKLLTAQGQIPYRGASGPAALTPGLAGQVLQSGGVGANPSWAAAGADYPNKLKPAVARYVIPGWYAEDLTTAIVDAGRIYYIPIFVSETTTYIRIGIRVGTGVVGTADLRIFAWNGGLPAALILSAGTVDTSVAAWVEIVINQQLTRGYYFLAMRCTGAPTLYGPLVVAAVTPPVPGFATTGVPSVREVVLYVDAAYANPAPAPTGVVRAVYAFVILREN